MMGEMPLEAKRIGDAIVLSYNDGRVKRDFASLGVGGRAPSDSELDLANAVLASAYAAAQAGMWAPSKLASGDIWTINREQRKVEPLTQDGRVPSEGDIGRDPHDGGLYLFTCGEWKPAQLTPLPASH